jgi:hypothetical protein
MNEVSQGATNEGRGLRFNFLKNSVKKRAKAQSRVIPRPQADGERTWTHSFKIPLD